MKKVLVVEDSTTDRQEWRRLLKKFSAQIDFDFAWSAKQKNVWSIQEIQNRIESYDYMFLDLAWTKEEEDLLRIVKRQSPDWLKANADQWQEIEVLGDLKVGEDGWVRNLQGLILLDSITDDDFHRPPIPVAVTVNFYSTDFAKFCGRRWTVALFLKWEDRDYIRSFVARILRG